MAKFVPLHNFCSATLSDVTPADTCLKFSDASESVRACARLGAGGHSYLMYETATGYQDVKVSCPDGSNLVLETGHGLTIPAGTTLYFDWSEVAMTEFIECVNDKSGSADEIDIKSDTLTASYDADGKLCIEIKNTVEESQLVWHHCNKEFYVEGGQIKVRPVAQPVADATINNATVTITDGKVTYSQGDLPIVSSVCGCKQSGN